MRKFVGFFPLSVYSQETQILFLDLCSRMGWEYFFTTENNVEIAFPRSDEMMYDFIINLMEG